MNFISDLVPSEATATLSRHLGSVGLRNPRLDEACKSQPKPHGHLNPMSGPGLARRSEDRSSRQRHFGDEMRVADKLISVKKERNFQSKMG